MECPVCLETKNKFIWFECAHHVCSDCSARMTQFHHTECPVCRHPVKAPIPEQVQERQSECRRGCEEECSRDKMQHLACGVIVLGVLATCVMSVVQPGC